MHTTQLKMMVLPRDCNKELRRLLSLEYTRTDTIELYNTLNYYLPPQVQGQVDFSNISLIDTLNLIILDHVVNVVKGENLAGLLASISNLTVAYDIEIRDEHLVDLLGDIFPMIQAECNDRRAKSAILNYIDFIVRRNQAEFYAAVQCLVEAVYINLRHMKERLLRGTLVHNDVPAVLSYA